MTAELIAFAGTILALQSGVLVYCMRIENRLTRLETIISLRKEERSRRL